MVGGTGIIYFMDNTLMQPLRKCLNTNAVIIRYRTHLIIYKHHKMYTKNGEGGIIILNQWCSGPVERLERSLQFLFSRVAGAAPVPVSFVSGQF